MTAWNGNGDSKRFFFWLLILGLLEKHTVWPGVFLLKTLSYPSLPDIRADTYTYKISLSLFLSLFFSLRPACHSSSLSTSLSLSLSLPLCLFLCLYLSLYLSHSLSVYTCISFASSVFPRSPVIFISLALDIPFSILSLFHIPSHFHDNNTLFTISHPHCSLLSRFLAGARNHTRC